MRSVAIAIALSLIATVAFAKGGGGGGGAGSAGARAAVSATTGAGAVVVPGTLTQPGIVTAPGVATPQGTVVGNTIVVPPAIVVPGLAPSAAVTTPGATAPPAVVQPVMITPPSAGTQLGAGIGNQVAGFNAQAATQSVPPGATSPFTGPVSGSTVGPLTGSTVASPGLAGVVVAPVPIGIPIVGPAAAGAPSGAPAVSAASPSPLVIAAPSTPVTADSAARARTLPPDAAGVVVEQMMIAEVVGVDRDAGCITARGPNGDRASYRTATRAADSATVNPGDRIVVEVQRPLLASHDVGGAPSAFPRLSERDSAAQTGRSSPGSFVDAGAKRTADTDRRTIIWSMGSPPMVISDHAVACGH